MSVRKRFPEANAMSRTESIPLSKFWTLAGFLLILLVIPCHSSALAGDYFLYLPNPADSGSSPPLPGEGVLVKKISIKRGDTLSALSRRFSGKSTYYPQILLFNKIRNPNLIYAGQELLMPLSRRLSRHWPQPSPAHMPPPPGVRPEAPFMQKNEASSRRESVQLSAERQLFDQAVALFTQRKYREALEGFDSFLKLYPHSSLVPDASLYRGDCFLRLSEI